MLIIVDRDMSKFFVHWEAPLEHWIRLNIDGVSKGNLGVIGAGGILRGHYGNWIKGFAINLGTCTYVKAELTALIKGLRLAKSQGVSQLIIHTDSQVVLSKMKTSLQRNKEYYHHVKESQELLHNPDWKVILEHCLCE